MRNPIPFAMAALLLVTLAACGETAPPAEPESPVAAVDLPDLPPEASVAEADILKAANIYKALHDDTLDEAQQQDRAAALMTEAGWSEDRYNALMFDISAHPASREAYLKAIE